MVRASGARWSETARSVAREDGNAHRVEDVEGVGGGVRYQVTSNRAAELRAMEQGMNTMDQFRTWAQTTVRVFLRDGAVCRTSRNWADEVRPFDPVLADLYIDAAKANEAIRAHLAKRVDLSK
jgi:hypothetical protein